MEEVEFDKKPATRKSDKNEENNDGNKYFEKGESCLSKKWNSDWDKNDGLSNEGLKGVLADRIFILIRAGESGIKYAGLTSKGLTQTMATSSRLQMLGMFPQMILTSSSQSCLQTAQIIHSQFKEAILSINSDLVDGAPVIPSPDFNYNMERSSKQVHERVEAFLREYFHRPFRDHTASHSLIVLEDIILKYFLLRLLQLPAEAFQRFQLPHASITQIHIRYDGSVFASLIGDSGHMTYQTITY